jgi:hypothetical protein
MKMIQRLSIILLVIAMWIGASVACVGVAPKEGTPALGTDPAQSQAPIIPSSKLGETVENLGYSLTVTKIEDRLSTNSYNAPKPGYKRIAVEITLGNVSGAEPLDVFYHYANLVDSNGFVYEADSGSGEDDLAMVTLNVGEKVKGWVYFIIPDDVTPAYIKFKIDSENFLVAGLGE